MSKEKLFDEEISACISTSAKDPLCSATIISKKIMLRITTDSADIQRGFEVEIYDEQNVDFLYSGAFSHSKFSDLKQRQHFTFSIDQAPKKIVAFVRDLRQDNMKFVNCTLYENSDKNKSYCKFDLVTRSDFKDMCMMSLELKKVQGDQLNAHLIQFIEKYKQRCEEIPVFKKQYDNLQIEHKRIREELRANKEESAATIQELQEKNEELMDEVRNKAAEAKYASEEAETLEADLRSLTVSYKNQLAEHNELVADNEKFVYDLDQCEVEIAALQEQLKESLQQKEEFCKLYKEADSKLKSYKGSANDYARKFSTSENRCQLLEEEVQKCQELLKNKIRELKEIRSENEFLKAEKVRLSIEIEGLKTHIDLLTTQMNEIQQKKASAYKARLFKSQQ